LPSGLKKQCQMNRASPSISDQKRNAENEIAVAKRAHPKMYGDPVMVDVSNPFNGLLEKVRSNASFQERVTYENAK
jgi:hypothetical protein